MKRSLRVRFAVLSACVIAFAQIAVAAQAWPLDAALQRHSAPAAPTSAADASEHCAGHIVGADGAPTPSPNFCEVRCQDAAQPDAMVVAVAAPIPDGWLSAPLAEAAIVDHANRSPLAAKCASPPARLLFARFLI